MAADLPARPGTYLLWVPLDRSVTLETGRWRGLILPPGIYAYVGSAFGPGGLRARAGRHLRRDKVPHWHIDALTASAPVQAIWFTTYAARLECTWAEILAASPGVTLPAPGFGSSDCACRAHLFRVPPDTLPALRDALRRPAAWERDNP